MLWQDNITQWLLAIRFAISMIGIFNVARLPITKPIWRAG
jgi:Flp pilus assembly protein TadB